MTIDERRTVQRAASACAVEARAHEPPPARRAGAEGVPMLAPTVYRPTDPSGAITLAMRRC
jgi:hypothetical protein